MAETCPELLASCDCTKPAGHVAAGDPDHLCTPDCGGTWRGGEVAGSAVTVMRYPRPTDPALAHVAELSDRLNAAMPPEGVPYDAEPAPLTARRGGITYGGGRRG